MCLCLCALGFFGRAVSSTVVAGRGRALLRALHLDGAQPVPCLVQDGLPRAWPELGSEVRSGQDPPRRGRRSEGRAGLAGLSQAVSPGGGRGRFGGRRRGAPSLACRRLGPTPTKRGGQLCGRRRGAPPLAPCRRRGTARRHGSRAIAHRREMLAKFVRCATAPWRNNGSPHFIEACAADHRFLSRFRTV